MSRFDTIQAFINGQPHPAKSAETLTNVYPGTGEVICEVEISLNDEIDLAVATATQAQREWRKKSGVERGRVLQKAAQLLRQSNDELATLEVWDSGKPISEANTVDIHSGADCLEYFGGIAAGIKGDQFQLGDDFAYTIREPLGVVGGIGAWNYPLQIACWKAAPALAAGNGMVFKPSEMTPMTAVKLAEVLIQAGAPIGLFNVVQGDSRTGKLLTQHPGLAKISLTGSVETGRKVMAGASETLKHVSFELGGKSPLIILDDANLDNAVKGAILANFYTQGEICTNGTRVFVHDKIHDRFVDQLVCATKKLKIGDPFASDTEVGALISQDHMDKVLGYIAKGKSEGANCMTGGQRVGAEGYFVEPTIFTDCHDDMTIVREEIFGPVMSILRFSDGDEEIVERANATHFGLAAGVFTENLGRGHRMAAQLEAGICWLNTYNITPIEIPFGGNKQSGIGRENSAAALDHYTQLKTVYVATGDL